MRVLMASAFAFLVGCGSASDDAYGPDPDFGTLDSELTSATGTLDAGGVSRAVEATNALRAPELSIVELAHVAPSKTTCPALAHGDATGSCPCPDGGSYSYDFSELVGARKTGEAAVLRMRFDGCAAVGLTLDGPAFAHVGGAGEAITADVEVTRAGTTSAVHVWRTAGDWWSRVTVGDGMILVGLAPDEARRDVVVRDRVATWTCSGERCTEPGGATRDLT